MTHFLRLLEPLRDVARHPIVVRSGREWLFVVAFVILVVPAGPNHVLIPMLAVTCAVGGGVLLGVDRRGFETRLPILLFAAAGAALAVHGLARSNAGWTDVAIPLVGGPVAWFLMSQLADEWWSERVITLVSAATIAISVMVLAMNLGVGVDLVRWIEPGAFSFRGEGVSRTRLAGLTTLISTIPILLSLLVDHVLGRIPLPNRWLHLAALALSAPAVLLSGRQGIVGAVLLFPVLLVLRELLGFGVVTRAMWSRRSVAVLAGAVAVAVAVPLFALNLSPTALISDILAAVGLGESTTPRIGYTARVRSLQSASLLDGFAERPIFGHGAGAVSPDFYTWRGFEIGSGFDFEPRPWRAELSYHLLLFEGGIVGGLLYIGAALVAGIIVRREYRRLGAWHRSIVRATVVGALSMLVGAAFNPHLRAVGTQLLLFLPVIVASGFARSPAGRRTRST